jgi:pimeloyl-ACP methyl ester carboxylesterase
MPLSDSALLPPLAQGMDRLGFGSLSLAALKQRYGHPEQGSRFVRLDGFNLHYRDQGDRNKPVLVLIHGVVASLHTWEAWLPFFTRDYRVIRFDVPGFGLTGPPSSGEYSAKRMLKVLDLLLDHLDVSSASLVGNSLGGYLAWNYALLKPERVEKLVLIDPAAYPMTKIPWMIASAGLPGATLAMPIWMPRALIAEGVKQVYGEPARIQPGLVERYYDLSRRPGNRLAMMKIFRLLMQVNRDELHTTPARVAAIQAPTLLLWGARDRWISPSDVPLWQRDLPSIQVQVYAGVGHVPMEEIPAQSAADTLRFLQA